MPATKTVPTRKDGAGAGIGISGVRKSQVDELGYGSEDEMNMVMGTSNIPRHISQTSPGMENIAPEQTKAKTTKMRRGRKPFTARPTAKSRAKSKQLAGKRNSNESATIEAFAPAATTATAVKSEAPVKRPGRRAGRAALAEIENENEKVGATVENEEEDMDDLDDSAVATTTSNGQVSPSLMGSEKAGSGARPTRGRKRKVDKSTEEEKTAASDAVVNQVDSETPSNSNANATSSSNRTRPGRPQRRAFAEQKAEHKEEAEDAMDAEASDQTKAESHAHAIQSNTTRRRSISTSRRAMAESARERQRQKQRAESASDIEHGGAYESGPASLRRKLTDITNKFESLEVQYRDLEEVGVLEAERNFDKLKKASEEKTKAANDLIASLRADLAAQKAVAAENALLKKQIAELTSTSESLTSQSKTLQSSLNASQNEIKALQAKVAATRATSATIAVPDSAVKGSSNNNHSARGNAKTVLVGSAEAAKEAQKRVLKEEFYSDLTGLLVLDVKRNEESGEDVYDCIQTGRNGTLHFYLSVASSSSSKDGNANATATSYENEEFTYMPHLDASRDRDLLQILPDYLTEEICFPRSNAAKFYGRVVDCMVKKIELVDNVDEQ